MRWKPVINAFAITFGDRWPTAETCQPTNAGNTVGEIDPAGGGVARGARTSGMICAFANLPSCCDTVLALARNRRVDQLLGA
jgi:hypothetical protein